MRKLTKVIATALAMTMLFSTVVMGASSPSTNNTPAPSAPVATALAAPAVSNSLSTAGLAPTTVVTSYTAGVASETAGVAVAPVNAATVNYATLGAKLLVGPTAVVFKSMTLTGNANNVSVAVPGLANGQQVFVLAYDLATGTWKKVSCKVKNGKISFKKGEYSTFSLVSNVVAP